MADQTVTSGASPKPVALYGAIGANLAIAVTKFIAAAVSGSAAMTAEGIHSSVDTLNALLLLLGVKQSTKPPDEDHPYGYGKELYFWSLIVAIFVFALGGGMSIYEGITRWSKGRPIGNVRLSYLVLAVAFVFEGVSWTIALRELARGEGESLWHAVVGSKDPTVFSVFAEDSGALLGLVVAFAGIFLSRLLGIPELDALASCVIGVILLVVALFLIRESRNLLVGESADAELVRHVRALAQADPSVYRVGRPLTMHLGPRQILLNLDVEFRPNLDTIELAQSIERLEQSIRAEYPDVQRIFIEAHALHPS